jgi:tetratricopeptide (TPR) repeat protein
MAKTTNKDVSDENSLNYLRESANKLKASGVLNESLRLYEDYVKQVPLERKERAKLSYSMGEMAEELGLSEKALSYYIQAEILDVGNEVKGEAKKKIVAMFERLGKFSAVKYALKESTSLNPAQTSTTGGGIIVAKVGTKNIYLHEVNEALDSLPQDVRKTFETKDGKVQFAQKFIADEIIYQKALRQGMDKDAQLKKQMEMIEKNVLVQKVMEQDVLSKIKVADSDVKNYYEAHKDKYKKQAFDKVKTEVEMEYKQSKAQELFAQFISDTLKTDEVKIFMDKIK